MIKSKYTTREICNIFGVGRETLRHYENVGILDPKINPKNGYREYGYWDVGLIVDTLKYRSVGFSLNETKEAIFNKDYPDVVDAIKLQHKYFEDRIIHYTMLAEKTKKDLEYLEYGKNHLFELSEGKLPDDMIFVPFETDENAQYFDSMRQAFGQSQFFSSAWIMDKDDGKEKDPGHGMGLVAEKKYVKHLHLKQGVDIKAGNIVYEMIDVMGRDIITNSYFTDFEKQVYLIFKNYKLSDETYAVLISRFYDSDKVFHQYFFVFKNIIEN